MKSSTGETKLKSRLSKLFYAFRQGSGVPPWLVTDTAVAMFIDQTDKWIHLLPPIGFAEILDFLHHGPYFEQIPVELVKEESKSWAEHNQIRDALLAVDRLLSSLSELWHEGKLAQGSIVLRTLPVLGVLSWSAKGSKTVSEVAGILGCSQATPTEVFDSYRMAIESGDEDTLLKLQQLVDSDPTFSSWTKEFSEVAAKVNLPERPAPLPFISLVSSMLLRILEMEGKSDLDREDN